MGSQTSSQKWVRLLNSCHLLPVTSDIPAQALSVVSSEFLLRCPLRTDQSQAKLFQLSPDLLPALAGSCRGQRRRWTLRRSAPSCYLNSPALQLHSLRQLYTFLNYTASFGKDLQFQQVVFSGSSRGCPAKARCRGADAIEFGCYPAAQEALRECVDLRYGMPQTVLEQAREDKRSHF